MNIYSTQKLIKDIQIYVVSNRTMIEEGKGKLEWERKIPDEKLGELKTLLDDKEFKKNLPKVIKRIYELAWEQFSDLPRGHHKVRTLMSRFEGSIM